jgi:effector-binding domain-containing protein
LEARGDTKEAPDVPDAGDTATRIDRLPPQPTAAVRIEVPQSGLAAAFDRYMPLIAARIGEAGGSPGGPPFARYYDFSSDHVDVEIGFPTAGEAPDLPTLASCAPGEVGRSELPGGPVARTTHLGPYDGLSTSYDRLHEWIHEQPGVDDGDGPWEVYVDDPGSASDPAELRTEIVWPLRTG